MLLTIILKHTATNLNECHSASGYVNTVSATGTSSVLARTLEYECIEASINGLVIRRTTYIRIRLRWVVKDIWAGKSTYITIRQYFLCGLFHSC
jgi:hypothetical protein